MFFQMSRSKGQYFVYILSNQHGMLYTGVTSNLVRRLEEHRRGEGSEYTSKFQITRLVYWESTPDVRSALAREKEVKSWRRKKKLELIRTKNPTFRDLADDFD
jgi:putative endonuclease